MRIAVIREAAVYRIAVAAAFLNPPRGAKMWLARGEAGLRSGQSRSRLAVLELDVRREGSPLHGGEEAHDHRFRFSSETIRLGEPRTINVR
jgi:hypothetical protein